VSPFSSDAPTIVGLDTATGDVAVAATRGEDLVEERLLEGAPGERPRHATALLGEVESIVEGVGGWRGVDAIAVGIGPGSFTGLRIGLATARALAQALAKPLVPVGTLAVLARGLHEREPECEALPIIDARRGQVFAALYGPDGEELWAPLVATPEELSERLRSLSGTPVAVGSGAVRFRRELEAAGAEVVPESDSAHRVSGRQLCVLAEAGTPSPPESIRPIYLRPPDAELWLERDTS
jgi:tRNA threonylcarbamoyladenosine biosynthesis protein TsaB